LLFNRTPGDRVVSHVMPGMVLEPASAQAGEGTARGAQA
jgi:hypothetical protein